MKIESILHSIKPYSNVPEYTILTRKYRSKSIVPEGPFYFIKALSSIASPMHIFYSFRSRDK